MPLQLGSRTAVLEGTVTVEEAEPLAAWLRQTAGPRVNLRDCSHLHTAALQALLAARVKVSVLPADAFLRAWVAPLLERFAATPDQKPLANSSKEAS
ncbi:hypothetical protein [Motilibacter deserti]|uniref:STAS domain-containing protein n=1 Tax=Motilibacter deserti TaxID=2714956 RepID=A0ABX0GWG4_9ACTN|nr:hypothetical protein [Motilibacter deserti]NHC15281.1 hypothetical protein [Motilibacter deserti]